MVAMPTEEAKPEGAAPQETDGTPDDDLEKFGP